MLNTYPNIFFPGLQCSFFADSGVFSVDQTHGVNLN